MTATPVVSNAFVRAALDAGLAKLNVGGGGHIKVFTGSPPATCETADSGTQLVQLALSATAFANSVDNSAGGATATANAITNGTPSANGTAGYFRGYDASGTCWIQGTVGTSSADMIINSTSVVTTTPVSCSSWTVTQPDGSGSD